MARTKTSAQQAATSLAGAAKLVTYRMRVHGWRRRWDGVSGEFVPTDAEHRKFQAQLALDHARRVELQSTAVRRAVEEWARGEGAV